MDLSFKFERNACVTPIEPDLAVLLVGIAARQAASPTAGLQARLCGTAIARTMLAPLDGAFHAAASHAVTSGKHA